MSAVAEISIKRNAPIPTWFGVGGGADALATPQSVDELQACLAMDPGLRVLGDGANLLVGDEGVGGVVVSLTAPEFAGWQTLEETRDSAVVRAGAGAMLPRLILETVRSGLEGLEGLAGIPATMGGALVMNAGGAFGQIADVVERVRALDREGRAVELERHEIGFGYRRSGLSGLILTGCDLNLRRGDAKALRRRLKEVMAYKKDSQPMGERSAGCCYRNPTLEVGIEGIGEPGSRVSAGLLIDRAGCKGLTIGGASVSMRHANFFPVKPGASASHVIDLMDEVERRVFAAFGVHLEREVVVWRRGGA